MMKTSKLITFEGGEGSGKTTLIKSLQSTLEEKGISTIAPREPGGTALGEEIRSLLLNKKEGLTISSQAEALLFLTARAQQIQEVILPALNQGKVVLCDRFHESTIVYQGIARGLGKEKIEQLCLAACGDLLPDLTFFLDIDPTLGLKRCQADALDRIEQEKVSFHENVRSGYQQLAASNPRIHTLDASQTKEEVFSDALQQLQKELGV